MIKLGMVSATVLELVGGVRRSCQARVSACGAGMAEQRRKCSPRRRYTSSQL